MVADLIRDSTVGQFINYVSSGRFLPYPDQRPDFVVPTHFLPPSTPEWDVSDAVTLCGDAEQKKSGTSTPALPRQDTLVIDEKEISMKLGQGTVLNDPNIVGWYGEDDPDNPR